MTASAPRIAQFSLKHLLLASTALAGVLGLGIAYGYGVASTLVLVFGVWLTVSGFRKQRIGRQAVGIPFALAGGYGAGLALVHWWATGVGPVFLPAYYPEPVQHMLELAQADPWKTKVYRRDNGTDFYLEDVCRMELSQFQADWLVTQLGLEEVSELELGSLFFQHFPRGWRPRPKENATYYRVTDNNATYEAMYDSQSGHFYVWRLGNCN